MIYRRFTDAFKKMVVEEYLSGKPMKDILRNYDLHKSVLRKWRDKYLKFGTFPDGRGKSKTGRPRKVDTSQMTQEEYVHYLKMENDILKQLCSLSKHQPK